MNFRTFGLDIDLDCVDVFEVTHMHDTEKKISVFLHSHLSLCFALPLNDTPTLVPDAPTMFALLVWV